MTANLIRRIAECLRYGESTASVRAKLLAEGLDEGQAFLIFKAAQIMAAR